MGERADISDATAPCSECGTHTLTELLERTEAPLADLVCPECKELLDGEVALERLRRRLDAAANGGFREGFFEMVGDMDL